MLMLTTIYVFTWNVNIFFKRIKNDIKPNVQSLLKIYFILNNLLKQLNSKNSFVYNFFNRL